MIKKLFESLIAKRNFNEKINQIELISEQIYKCLLPVFSIYWNNVWVTNDDEPISDNDIRFELGTFNCYVNQLLPLYNELHVLFEKVNNSADYEQVNKELNNLYSDLKYLINEFEKINKKDPTNINRNKFIISKLTEGKNNLETYYANKSNIILKD